MAYTYNYNVVYNKAMSPYSATPDNELSLKIAKTLVEKCDGLGYGRSFCHYRDFLPGSNIFTEHSKVIKNSKFTLLILTEGFIRDCWAKYRTHTALSILLADRVYDRLIPIAIGLDRVPEELGSFDPLYFPSDLDLWETDDCKQSWDILFACLRGEQRQRNIYYDQHGQIVQEAGDNQPRTELMNAFVAQTTPSLETSMSESSDSGRIMVEQPATVELHPVQRTSQASQGLLVQLDASPVIRPPATIPPSVPPDASIQDMRPPNLIIPAQPSNLASEVIYRGDENTRRQVSLSNDTDLATDAVQSPLPGWTPVSVDSGCIPSASSPSTGTPDSLREVGEINNQTSSHNTDKVKDGIVHGNTSVKELEKTPDVVDNQMNSHNNNLDWDGLAHEETTTQIREEADHKKAPQDVNSASRYATNTYDDNNQSDTQKLGAKLMTEKEKVDVSNKVSTESASGMIDTNTSDNRADTTASGACRREKSFLSKAVGEFLSWMTKPEFAYHGVQGWY